jgi:hypothetical protein
MLKTNRAATFARIAGPLCILALAPAGCDVPSGPPPAECTREIVFSRTTVIAPSTQIVQRFTTPRTGRLRFSVDWVNPENIVSVVLAEAPCGPDEFKADACNVIANLFPPPKPLADTTTWLNPGDYDLVIGNFAPVDETTTTNVELSSAGCLVP